jgi:hypothetical protein
VTGEVLEVDAAFDVAGLKATEHVFARNVDALSKRAGVHIDGPLDQDVLRHFKQISIDYQHSVVELR